MLSRKELEDYIGHRLTDTEWLAISRQMSDIADRLWEEEHPLDL